VFSTLAIIVASRVVQQKSTQIRNQNSPDRRGRSGIATKNSAVRFSMSPALVGSMR